MQKTPAVLQRPTGSAKPPSKFHSISTPLCPTRCPYATTPTTSSAGASRANTIAVASASTRLRRIGLSVLAPVLFLCSFSRSGEPVPCGFRDPEYFFIVNTRISKAHTCMNAEGNAEEESQSRLFTTMLIRTSRVWSSASIPLVQKIQLRHHSDVAKLEAQKLTCACPDRENSPQ